MKKVLFLGWALSTAIFAGCQRDQNPSSEVSMSFSAAFDQEPTVGKAARNNAFLSNDQIGIFVVPYASMSPETPGVLYGKGNYADNVPFVTTNGTTFAPAPGNTIAYPNAQTKVDVYAFGLFNAVYQDLGNDPKNFAWTVDATQATDAAILRNDLMSATTSGVTPSATPIALTFKHRLAKVDATIVVPTTFRGQNVAGSTLFIDGTRLKATVDMTDPNSAVTVPTTNNATQAIEAFKVSGGATGACTFQAIILPCTVAENALSAHLVLTLADASTVTLECRSGAPITYETGNQTQITFTIENEYTLNLGTIGITAWGTGGNHAVVARRPARLIFGTDGNATTAASVVLADLSIDDTTYKNVSVVYHATDLTLTCTYLQPTTRTDGDLKAVVFKQANGTSVSATFDQPLPCQIPKNPGNTDPNYNNKTSTAKF